MGGGFFCGQKEREKEERGSLRINDFRFRMLRDHEGESDCEVECSG
jgi:hypothetical protein